MGASRASIRLLVLAGASLLGVGCAPSFQKGLADSPLQLGLANAPWLGGTTPETRVHDVIANGRDSCERSAFPEGEVLRGEIPSCVTNEPAPRVPQRIAPPVTITGNLPGYSLGPCPSAWLGSTPSGSGIMAASLWPTNQLLCEHW